MNYIKKWCDNILHRSSLTLQSSIHVTGLHDEHVGPTLEYAEVDVVVTPSSTLEVYFNESIDKTVENMLFLDAAVFGLLDIMLVYNRCPLRNISIKILNIQSDPISSSQIAFRCAGRDAGEKIMSILQEGRGSERT